MKVGAYPWKERNMQEPRSEVVSVATSDSIWNREPVATKAAIVGVAGAVGSVLVISGVLTEAEKVQLIDSLGVIVGAAFLIAPIIAAAWGRASVNSPKTSAKLAIQNVDQAYEAGKVGQRKPDPIVIPVEPLKVV